MTLEDIIGEPLTKSDLAEFFGVKKRKVREILRELKDDLLLGSGEITKFFPQ